MKKLAKALRTHADTVEDTHTSELLRVFARLLEGKTLYKTFGAPGDWGYGTPIGDGVIEMLRAGDGDKLLGEPLEWHYVPELPDDEVRCLIATDNPHSDELAIGYHRAGRWEFEEDEGANPVVYAWAHMPSKPAKKGGAS